MNVFAHNLFSFYFCAHHAWPARTLLIACVKRTKLSASIAGQITTLPGGQEKKGGSMFGADEIEGLPMDAKKAHVSFIV